MANRRMIDADLFEDEFVSSLDFFGRFLWIGLFASVADDQGRCLDNPAIIRARVFPFDHAVDDALVEAALNQMAKAGKILRYQNGNKRLVQIVKWWTYQNPSWASESKHAAPEGWIDRVKYHSKGNRIITENWEAAGGFDSQLPSTLPSELGSGIEEKKQKQKQKDEQKDEQKGEQEQKHESAPAAQKPAAGGALNREHGEIFRIFEQEIGPLTPLVAEALIDLERDYPPEWFRMACREAVMHNARNMKYVKAILQRWKVQGLPDGSGPPGKVAAGGNGHAPRAKYDTSELDALIAGGKT